MKWRQMAGPGPHPTLAWPVALLAAVAGFSVVARAQQTPALIGGTVGMEGTTRAIYAAANTIIVKTIDGVERTYHFTKNVLVHGGKGGGVDALQGLTEGSTVVVHSRNVAGENQAQEIDIVGDGGLKVTEGIVTNINREKKEITVRLDNGRIEKLRLTDRAAADVGKDLDKGLKDSTRVVVYYSDEAGNKVAHYFRANR